VIVFLHLFTPRGRGHGWKALYCRFFLIAGQVMKVIAVKGKSGETRKPGMASEQSSPVRSVQSVSASGFLVRRVGSPPAVTHRTADVDSAQLVDL